MYTDTIRKWAADTRHAGTLTNPSGVGEVGLEAQQAGRQIAVRFALRLAQQRVEEVRFQVYGCGYSIAACAAAADLAADHSLGEVASITSDQVDALLNLPDDRKYCADLAVQALQAAVDSSRTKAGVVQAQVAATPPVEHAARISEKNPIYQALLQSPNPKGVSDEDRHLFACLLAVAHQEGEIGPALGLKSTDLDRLLRRVFPRFDRTLLLRLVSDAAAPQTADPEVRALLLDFVPKQSESPLPRILALTLATRAALPGHLWVALGLFDRPELSSAIRRHLPGLAAANSDNMRWKRFFAKQICDAHGGTLCKAPTCGECPEKAECFPPEEGVFT